MKTMKKTVNGRVKAAVCTLVTLGLLTAPVVGNCHDPSPAIDSGSPVVGWDDGSYVAVTVLGFGVITLVALMWATDVYNPTPYQKRVAGYPILEETSTWYADVEVGDKSGFVLGFTF